MEIYNHEKDIFSFFQMQYMNHQEPQEKSRTLETLFFPSWNLVFINAFGGVSLIHS